MSSPVVRYFALLLLVLGQAPVVLAGLMVAGGLRSDHEVQCDFNLASVNVTLHHLREPADHLHGHNWAERLLVGESVSSDEPDHHFGYDRQSVFSEEEELRSNSTGDECLSALPTTELWSAGMVMPEEYASLRLPVEPAGQSPPRVERRGVVMRL
jgi:hypothetical protein